eukprot:sb/3465749/
MVPQETYLSHVHTLYLNPGSYHSSRPLVAGVVRDAVTPATPSAMPIGVTLAARIVMDDVISLSLTQRVFLIPFGLICSTTGLLGNGLVLYSSLRYDSIKLDHISLIFLQNLALADFLNTALIILPTFITYTAGRWLFGSVFCDFQLWSGYITATVNILTVISIACHRLRVLLSPLRVQSAWTAKLVVICVWVVSPVIPVVSVLWHGMEVGFYPLVGWCSLIVTPDNALLVGILIAIVVVIPLCLITTLNVIILFLALRHTTRNQSGVASQQRSGGISGSKALITTTSLCGLFALSWAPYIGVYVVGVALPGRITIGGELNLTAAVFLWFAVVGNPVLYTVTNRRFACYVRALVSNAAAGVITGTSSGSVSTSNA